MSEVLTPQELFNYTVQITAAYLSQHDTTLEDLPEVISKTYQALNKINKDPNSLHSMTPQNPAVPISESVKDDYIICLEDGKKLQMLKRHLNTVYKMSLEQYREKWGLPTDYPMVSPNYAKRRSQIAKNTGLGVNGRRRAFKVVSQTDGQKQIA
jgi:predicted transcriptional regulator